MLKETLTPELVTVDLQGSDKPSIIRALLDMLCRTEKVKDQELALKDLLDHEAEMSTGMENGIAVPHVKTDAVDELLACVGITKKKIDFESLDRQPSRIFIMTLSPKGSSGPHARFLGDIARLLSDAKMRKKILKTKSDEQLLELLTN